MTHILTTFAKRNIQTPTTGLPKHVIPLVQRKERETYNEVIKPILMYGSGYRLGQLLSGILSHDDHGVLKLQ